MSSNEKGDLRAILGMLSTALDPELQICIGAIRQVADYDIPKERAASFLRFHAFITSPQPAYITDWRQDPDTERRWYHRHVNGILGDVRGALAATHYHADRLQEIESSVNGILSKTQAGKRLQNSTIGLGGTRKMDIEYQGFVLAYRRCLDYLAGALGCYFKREADSFRTFPKSIAKGKSQEVATALIEAHTRHVGKLAFVLAVGRKSVRHRIAHYEFVSAGTVNLTPKGFFLAGGGEELRMLDSPSGVRLSEALCTRLEDLYSCVDDMIDTFVHAARKDQP